VQYGHDVSRVKTAPLATPGPKGKPVLSHPQWSVSWLWVSTAEEYAPPLQRTLQVPECDCTAGTAAGQSRTAAEAYWPG
jgi:hypothetical protein